MSQQDIDNEISPVSYSKGSSRGLFVGVIIGLSLLVMYFAASSTDEDGRESTDPEDKPVYNVADYDKKQLASLDPNFLQLDPDGRDKALYRQTLAQKKIVEEKKKKTAADTHQLPADSRELRGRLRSPMVAFYDKKSFEAQGSYSARAKLNSHKLSDRELAQKMLSYSSKSRNTRFADSAYSTEVRVTHATKLTDLEYTILQGKQIPAVLETPIHSKMPGPIRAVISENVYGERGRNVLIPRGSRLIGTYNSQTELGQSRVYVVWTRIITPNNINIRINSPGGDQMGTMGLPGKVNHHFFKRFGNAILLSIIGSSAQVVGVRAANRANSRNNLRQMLGSNLQIMASDAVNQSGQITPTITLPQGAKVIVSVARDIRFKQVKTIVDDFQ